VRASAVGAVKTTQRRQRRVADEKGRHAEDFPPVDNMATAVAGKKVRGGRDGVGEV